MAAKTKVVVKKVSGAPPIKNEWSDSDVTPIQKALQEVFDKLGGVSNFIKKDNKVLIKPNLVCGEPPDNAVATDARVIEALIKICKNAGASRVIVADHPMGAKVPEITGMTRAAQRAGGEALNLYEVGNYETKEFNNTKVLKKADVPRLYYEMDAVINVPKMKTHLTTVVTLGMKNMMGLLPFPSWIAYHREDLYDAIVDLALLFKPTLTIIDGIVAQEGHGPMYGFPVPDMNVLVAGTDQVAVDVVGAKIMGISTIEAPVIRAARARGVGTTYLKDIEIVGDKVEKVARNFLRAIPNVVGYSRWDSLTYPFELYTGGPCAGGCFCFAREALDSLAVYVANKKIPESRKKKLIFIMGHGAKVPEKLPEDAAVFVLGDCAAEHKDKGVFCGGCICDVGTLYGQLGPKCIGEAIEHPFNSATREHLERSARE